MQMSKGIRRENRKIQENQLLLASKQVFVALDLGSKEHLAVFSDRADKVLGCTRIEHSTTGVDALLDSAYKKMSDPSPHKVLIFMEPTSHYWMNIANTLEKKGVTYRLIHPLTLARKREIHRQCRAKNDLKDAMLLLKLGLEGEFTKTQLEHRSQWNIMEFLASEHQDLVDSSCAEKNRIRAYLETIFPEYMMVFADPFGKTSLAVLENLSLLLTADSADKIISTTKNTFKGKRFYKDKVKKLFETFRLQPGFGVSSLREGAFYRIERSVRRLALYICQLDDVERRLVNACMASEYWPFIASIPVVGAPLKAQTLAFVGDPTKYDDSSCLVSLAGLDPAENESSYFKGKTMITRRGVARLRRTAIQAAYALIKGDKMWRGYFHKLTTRQENQLRYYQALAACAAKYLRLFWFLCDTRQTYDRRMIFRFDGQCRFCLSPFTTTGFVEGGRQKRRTSTESWKDVRRRWGDPPDYLGRTRT